MTADNGGRAHFDLEFAATTTQVTSVYRFTRDFYRGIVGDDDQAERLALTLYELLENAVRYSSGDNIRVRVDVGPSDDGRTLCVETVNRADSDHIDKVRTWLSRIHEADDPNKLYQQLMMESLQREEGSGLGLARVRCEAQMDLSYDLSDSKLTVRAKFQVPADQAA